jgi:hypothetical protein
MQKTTDLSYYTLIANTMNETRQRIADLVQKFNSKLAKHNLSIMLGSEEEGKKKDEDMALMSEAILEDGTSIFTPASEFTEGAEVFTKADDGTMQPLGDGEYTAKDGAKFTVAEGKITQITKASEEKPEVEEATENQMSETVDVPLEALVSKLMESIRKEMQSINKSTEAQFSALTEKIAKLEKDNTGIVETMSKLPAVTSVTQSRQVAERVDLSKMSPTERVRAIIEQNSKI